MKCGDILKSILLKKRAALSSKKYWDFELLPLSVVVQAPYPKESQKLNKFRSCQSPF